MKDKKKIYRELIGKAVKKKKGIKLLVKGGSMNPFIRDGKKLNIKESNKVSAGDIVLYKTKDFYLVHRVVKMLENGKVLVKGDSMDGVTHLIDRKKIIGKTDELWYKRAVMVIVNKVRKVVKVKE